MKYQPSILRVAFRGVIAFLVTLPFARAIETPPYETREKDGKYELRFYQKIAVASAPMQGMKERDKSFNRLFRYISGGNEKKAKIAMTSPVFLNEAEHKEAGKPGAMSFVIPAAVSATGAPKPSDGELHIGAIRGGKFAVLRFSGWTDAKKQEQAAVDLAQWIAKKGFKPEGSAFFAIYDPPWTLEMFRRNEIWQRVK